MTKHLKSIILLTTLTLTGCGVAEDIGSKCGGTLKDLCHATFGGRIDEAQEILLSEHEQRILSLETQSELLRSQALSIQNYITVLELNQSQTQDDIDMLQTQLNQISLQITNMTIQIAQLQGYQNITEIVTPCPSLNSPSGYREVLLRTSQGNVLAYFEAGNKRYLTALKANKNYMTTDGSGCMFGTDSDLNISW